MSPVPSLPAPRTWSPGDLVTVPRLRADLADTVALLGQRPYFVGQRSLGDSWSSGADLTLPMDVELTDAWGMHLAPPASGTSTVWAPLPGWYLTDARIPWSYAGTTPAPFSAGFQGLVNGAAYGPAYGAVAVNGAGQPGLFARCVDLIKQANAGAPNGGGDYIQPLARQDTGSSVTLGAAAWDTPTVSVRWVSALTGTQPLPVPPLTPAPSPITSSWLNANLRDAVRFLTYPPVMRAHLTGSASLAATTLASPAVVPLTATDVDNYGGLTTGSNALYTAPVAGRYLIAGQVNLAASSTTTWYACGIGVNSSDLYWGGITRFAGSSLNGGAGVTRRIRLNAGDQVQLVAAQASGAARAYNTAAAYQTRLIVVWEGI